MTHRTRWFAILGVVALIAGAAFRFQQPDLAGTIDFKQASVKINHNNTADSGIRIDRSGYACGALFVQSYLATNDASFLTNQMVIMDSTPGVAGWVARDSLAVDSVDNKNFKRSVFPPTPIGTPVVLQRWIRLLERASGAAADTFDVRPIWVLSCKRAR